MWNIIKYIFREFTVPTLDCIPLSEGLEPPMSRDTTFTSFLGGQTNMSNIPNGNITVGHTNGINTKEPTQN